ncbi:MAG TPA: efflux RND transporter periplasmic adaptor subunit [Pseudomonadota bacterium]|nr:efflux RND transporter periplasmic adaptor subunit [Pseudomonadota bacterium]
MRCFFGFAWFVGLALAGAGCGMGSKDARGSRPPPLVLVNAPIVRDVPVEVSSPVELRPKEQADLWSKQMGYLSAVLVERGDVVKKGQLLALVRQSDLPDQLGVAKGQLRQAQAALEQARINRGRLGSLAPTGVVSAHELQQSNTALAQAEAVEAAAQAQLQAIAVRLGEMRIESPIDGVVLQRRYDAGVLVGPQQGALLVLGRVDVLRAFVAVREQEAAQVAVGQKVILSVDALPKEEFVGTVVRLSPAFDSLSRTLDAEVHLQNQTGRLRPGMYGRARIQVGLHKQALVVPESAVQISGVQRFLFVEKDGKVQRRSVTLGVDGGTFLEIAKGLQPEEAVVVAGIDSLADGMSVRKKNGTLF